MTDFSLPEKIKALSFRVAEARQRDIGKGRARVSSECFSDLGASAGDAVEVHGKQKTVATVWPAEPEDQSLNIARIDSQTRKNAGTSLNDYITLKKVESSSAKSITLTPIGSKIAADGDFADFVRNRLRGTPVIMGDEIIVVVLGNPLQFKVVKTVPKACVKIESQTQLAIRT